MRVRLIRDTRVSLPAGFVVDVTDTEAARLIAFGNAEKAEAKAEAVAAKPVEQETEKPKKKAKK